MNEQILMAIYTEYAKSSNYKQFESYKDAVIKLDHSIQTMKHSKALDIIDESCSEVAITAEEQGFYNGFQCAVCCIFSDFAVKVTNTEAKAGPVPQEK